MPLNEALAKKLRLRAGQRALFLNVPDGYLTRGAPVDGVRVTTRASGRCDFVQLFATTRAELERLAPRALKVLAPDGLLWLSYPKTSSPLSADLTRDRGWDTLDAAGLRPVAQVAVDDTWSALRFRARALVRTGGSRPS